MRTFDADMEHIARLDGDIIEVERLIEYLALADELPDNEAVREARRDIQAVLDDIGGNGEDFRHEGIGYPSHLIRDSHFIDYVQDMVMDCGDIPKEFPTYIHIDWESTANDLRFDYSCVYVCGQKYWYR